MCFDEIQWANVFPYRDREVLVARLATGWMVRADGRTAEARTLIEAFEHLLGGRSTESHEHHVVLTALSRDIERRAQRPLRNHRAALPAGQSSMTPTTS